MANGSFGSQSKIAPSSTTPKNGPFGSPTKPPLKIPPSTPPSGRGFGGGFTPRAAAAAAGVRALASPKAIAVAALGTIGALLFESPAADADLSAIMPQNNNKQIQPPSIPFEGGQSPQIPYIVTFRYRRTGPGIIDTSWYIGQARVIGPITKIQVFVTSNFDAAAYRVLHIFTIFAGGGPLLGRAYDPTGKSKVYEWVINNPEANYELISIVRQDNQPDTGPAAPPPDPLINEPGGWENPGNPDRLDRNPGDRKSPNTPPAPPPLTPITPNTSAPPQRTPSQSPSAPSPNPDSVPAPSPTSPAPNPNINSSPNPTTGPAPSSNPNADKLYGPWSNPGPSKEGVLAPPGLPNTFSPNPITPTAPFTPTPLTGPTTTPSKPSSPIPTTTPPAGEPFTPTGPERAPTATPKAPEKPKTPTEPPPEKTPIEKLQDLLKPVIESTPFFGLIPAIARNVEPEAIRNAAAEGTCRTTQPGGCTSNLINNAVGNINQNTNDRANGLDAANAAANAAQLAQLQDVNARLGPAMPGGLSGGVGRLSRSLGIDRALNLINFVANLHNAFMLSNQLKITLLEMLSSVGNATGLLQTSENENVDLNAVFNAGVNSLMSFVLGDENYASLQVAWRKYNRIYQAATNSVYAISNMFNSLGNVVELTAEYTGKIGNSLRAAGMVAENAYQWMSEKANAKISKFITFENRINNTIQALEIVNEIAENVIEGQQAATEFQKANTEFVKAIEDAQKNPGTENKAIKEQMALNRENATKDPTGEDEEGLLSFLTDL